MKKDSVLKNIDADTVFGVWPKKDADISMERLLVNMAANGVSESLSLSAKGIFYSDKEGNVDTLKACAKQKSLLPVATINPRSLYPGEKRVKSLKKEGFKLIRFFSDLQGWSVEYLPFISLLDEIESAGLPIMFPSGPLGTATQLLRIMSGRKIKVIMNNVGYAQLSEVLFVMKDNKNFFVSSKLFNTPDGIELIVKHAGSNRLVLGSGQPFDYFKNTFSVINNAKISAKEKELILGKNIQAILK